MRCFAGKFVFISYDAETEKVPFVEPYVIPDGVYQGETVAALVRQGISGLRDLVRVIASRESFVDIYQCSNSVAYELMKEARKILDECCEDDYADYLCALYELFNVMPGREHFCETFFYADVNFDSVYELINYYEPCEHYDYLVTLTDDIVNHPMFYFCIESDMLSNTTPEGTFGVFPGMKVAVVQKNDQRTGKLTEGVVGTVFTKSAYHPRGIKVRLTNGKVGRVQKLFY